MKTIDIAEGKYSTAQMDNFYQKLAKGIIKPSGIMNYMQHFFIAERCKEKVSVLDVCCGRTLLLPLLNKYAPKIAKYVGIDISLVNLKEAKAKIKLDELKMNFPIELIHGDVTQLTKYVDDKYDVVSYTSALEHLDKKDGILSLQEVSKVLDDNGLLYLSTPNTPNIGQNSKQYSVHIFEWEKNELTNTLLNLGLKPIKYIGLLPPEDEILIRAIKSKFGKLGYDWFLDMKKKVPYPFLAPVLAASFPIVAKELLFICRKET